jgi:hypothetical protein
MLYKGNTPLYLVYDTGDIDSGGKYDPVKDLYSEYAENDHFFFTDSPNAILKGQLQSFNALAVNMLLGPFSCDLSAIMDDAEWERKIEEWAIAAFDRFMQFFETEIQSQWDDQTSGDGLEVMYFVAIDDTDEIEEHDVFAGVRYGKTGVKRLVDWRGKANDGTQWRCIYSRKILSIIQRVLDDRDKRVERSLRRSARTGYLDYMLDPSSDTGRWEEYEFQHGSGPKTDDGSDADQGEDPDVEDSSGARGNACQGEESGDRHARAGGAPDGEDVGGTRLDVEGASTDVGDTGAEELDVGGSGDAGEVVDEEDPYEDGGVRRQPRFRIVLRVY